MECIGHLTEGSSIAIIPIEVAIDNLIHVLWVH